MVFPGSSPCPCGRGQLAGPLPSLLRESCATRLILILEAGSLSQNLRRVSTWDPPAGVLRPIFLPASSIAAAVASAARFSGSSWAPAACRSCGCCCRAFCASRALSSALVLAVSLATFRHAVSMASRFAASAWAFISACFCTLAWARAGSNAFTSASFLATASWVARASGAAAPSSAAASASRLSQAAATSHAAAAVSGANLAATAKAWIAIPWFQWAASS